MVKAPSKGGVAHGVNVVGFFRAEFGQGEAARRVVSALERAGLAYTPITYGRIPHRQEHPFEPRDGKPAYGTNILCLNAEHLLQFVQDGGRELLQRRSSAGLWFWETNRLPRQLRPALDYVDEVWVASDFVAEAIAAETSKPVLTFPLPVPVPDPPSLSRADLGFPEDAFVFLFVFDFFSTLERKNPLGLIQAFKHAFPEPGRPLLHLKSINGARVPGDLARVREAVAGRPDIVLSDVYVDGERLTALSARCDCCVSLHRSEGFGLTIAEAMAFGKPAIATGYSGNLAFMDEESSYLVPYSLTTLDKGVGPYPTGTVWAEPDLEEAARMMREVFDDPERARERGERGRETLAERQSVDRAAEFLAERVPQLERLAAERRFRETPASRAWTFLTAGPSVAWDAPSRSGVAGRIWRRALLRLLRPYLIRQRELETLLVSGLDELERSRDRLEEAIQQLQSLFGKVSERVVQLSGNLRRLDDELHAEPYVADPALLRTAEGQIGFEGAAAASPGSTYLGFEDVFRGPEERVRELLQPYVDLLQGHAPVLDVGCGRGEFLDLLAEAGVEARGVDVNPGMVERCRDKGHQVEHANALSYLGRQPDESLGAVFAAQVIEHLAYEDVLRFFELSRRKLVPGGQLVAETVNPHSVPAFRTFWTDPSHRAPIFPEVAVALCRIYGFASARVVYPRPEEQTEYAVVATAPD